MRNVGIIDCGTNTFHLLIVDLKTHLPKILHQEKGVVKIGEGGINDRIITNEAKVRAINTIKGFKNKIDEHGVEEVHAFGTSAFRNASNGDKLKQQIFRNTGIDLNIIDGVKEAELIYKGILNAMDVGIKPVIAMDIGGGSVEFIIAAQSRILWRQSFEIGAQRLKDLFHKHDPIRPGDIMELENYLIISLKDLFNAAKKFQPVVLIGSSGTFDTLSEIYCNSNSIEISESQSETPLTVKAYYAIHKELISRDRASRLTIPGMIEMRVDMIVVASCIINLLLGKLPIESIRVSRYALKEGVLSQIVEGRGLE